MPYQLTRSPAHHACHVMWHVRTTDSGASAPDNPARAPFTYRMDYSLVRCSKRRLIVAGMDVSGNPESGNYEFMSIVIGREESLSSLVRRLGTESIYMNRIRDKKRKNNIIATLEFDRTECMALCIRLERNRVLGEFVYDRKEYKRVQNAKRLRAYHYLLWRAVRVYIEEFLHQHRCGVSDVVFQCDGDCKDFAKDVGLQRAVKGSAHMLADIVAWANAHGKEPSGTARLNLTDMLYKDMKRRCE